MGHLRVVEHCGPICVTPEDGCRLLGLIESALAGGDSVRVDFTGVTSLGGNFLMAAIGSLHGSFSEEDLAQRLRCEGLDPTDEAMLQIVHRKALLFFKATPAQREALIAAAFRATEV